MIGNSKEVESNQDGIHPDLEELVSRYLDSEFRRPIADHTREAFDAAANFVSHFQTPIILDSGCGTGLSTLALAKKFPENPILGIDKSEIRLSKATARGEEIQIPENVFYVRAELIDFWRLALDKVTSGQWVIPYHALYYPNPWPKQSEAGRRFHLHPIFPTLLQLAQETELRTNWEIYAREFELAAGILQKMPVSDCFPSSRVAMTINSEAFEPEQPITAFERKYKNASQQLWRVIVHR